MLASLFSLCVNQSSQNGAIRVRVRRYQLEDDFTSLNLSFVFWNTNLILFLFVLFVCFFFGWVWCGIGVLSENLTGYTGRPPTITPAWLSWGLSLLTPLVAGYWQHRIWWLRFCRHSHSVLCYLTVDKTFLSLSLSLSLFVWECECVWNWCFFLGDLLRDRWWLGTNSGSWRSWGWYWLLSWWCWALFFQPRLVFWNYFWKAQLARPHLLAADPIGCKMSGFILGVIFWPCSCPLRLLACQIFVC